MFSRVGTADFPETVIRYQNTAWANHLGFTDALENDALWIDRFARFKPLPGSLKAPLALAYHGHQFGVYNPEIGDGRGILYAQIEDPADGRLLDLGTKGSGLTPYSRTADGRLTLKGAVREILATEMLDALGVNTSKTFSVIETGEALIRGDEPSPTRSAVLVRLSHSHIRIGSFQRLAYLQDRDMLERLLRYTAAIYYEGSLDADAKPEDLAPAFVRAMGQRMAVLAASWMAAGFVHGVLNTDNFNITGESFDYGPWRFLPQMTPGFTAAYFDHQSRYAYGRQPEATLWALCRLADCLVALSSLEAMQSAVTAFQDCLPDAMTQALCRRLGIDAGWEERGRMTEALITAIRDAEIGFEEVLFDWYGGGASASRALSGKREKFYKSPSFAEARDLLREAPAAKGIRLDHSYFEGDNPQTMLIDEVEAIWDAIAADDDWSRLSDKIEAIHAMSQAYDDRSLPPAVRIPI
jgi:uncharacterized protein YdiU (UPF0061 family)